MIEGTTDAANEELKCDRCGALLEMPIVHLTVTKEKICVKCLVKRHKIDDAKRTLAEK